MANAGVAATWQDLLQDGFEGQDFSPAGGLYYRENLEQSAGRVEFQDKIVRSGKGALRLSVRPLCPPVDGDCSERAEIWQLTKLWAPYDRGIWHGFAVKFDDPIPRDDHRHVVAQWKRQILPDAVGDYSPFLALRLNHGQLFATVETNLVKATRTEPAGRAATCPAGETPVWLRPETDQTRALIATDANFKPEHGPLFSSCTREITIIDRGSKLPSPDSGWIDFAIYTKPGPDGSGHIEIFADGKWVVTVKGRIGHADDVGLGNHQYFKFGPYRAGGKGEWALFYDDYRRSPHCKDVLGNGACPF